MEDRETARMRKYGESKTTRIMMATVPHVASGLGLREFQADGFLLTRVYVRGILVRLQAGARHLSLPVQTGCQPPQPPVLWITDALSPEVKRPGHEADHYIPSSAEVKKEYLRFLIHLHGTYRG